ncbi:MAG: LemA family protein [Bradymonadales bacterium]|nr:MAG: LemA family protein [Bradymonadales bacterium]
MNYLLIGLFVLIGLSLIFIVSIYNRLVTMRNRFKNAYAQIDVQLRRRYDLIPNLVETAKGYMKHERETLEAVIQARNQASSANQKASQDPGDPNNIRAVLGAEGQLSGVLGRLFALAEAYPDLKANQNMMQLTEELTSTENRVAYARQAYNDSVMSYNTSREVFPNNLISGIFNFQSAQLFEVQEAAVKEAPKVSFG